MEITTKYEIGAVLWTIDNDEVTYFKVTGINVCAERNGNDAVITIKYKGESVGYHTEKQCFGSKEELINSLM